MGMAVTHSNKYTDAFKKILADTIPMACFRLEVSGIFMETTTVHDTELDSNNNMLCVVCSFLIIRGINEFINFLNLSWIQRNMLLKKKGMGLYTPH